MPGGKLKLGGKHKRGERGSVEEEQACKRSNMASEESESIDEEINITEAEEPTRLELKEMLVDIKIELSNFARENNKLANEMARLRKTTQEQKVELDSLKSSFIKVEKENNGLEIELSAVRKKIEEQEEEIAELYILQHNLEQYTRKKSLEICGIPDSAYSSTKEAVLQLAEKLGVPLSPEDINISHTIKRKGAGVILVKFQTHKAKSRFYKARIKLKNIRLPDVFPNASIATRVAAGQGRIFINENLTTYRKDLLRKANDKRKDGVVISAWLLDGKMFVKTSPSGTPIRIYEEEDLENL